MNKTYLTIAGVAVVALVGYGILSQEQGDTTTDLISSIEATTDSAAEATQEMATDATTTATDAMETAQDAVEESVEDVKDAIAPAAGETTEELEATQE